MPSFARLHHATLSDVGRRRLANEDAAQCDPRMGLYVVCDGIGGQPSGEAASQILAHAYPYQLRQRLRQSATLNADALRSALVGAVVDLSVPLYEQSRSIASLKGMGATIVAALIERGTAYIVHAGDSRAYLYRQGQLKPITRDHVRSLRRFKDESALNDQAIEMRERRLLMQFVGMPQPPQPEVATLPLEPGDRLLLCTDGVTDPVDEASLSQLLGMFKDPARAARALVDEANEQGGPDNITLTILDYQGLEDRRREPLPGSSFAPSLQGIAAPFHAALQQLDQDLAWLLAGTKECQNASSISAFAAVKRRLGPELYSNFLKMHPSKNPAHVFHRACTLPGTGWRGEYEKHLLDLEGPLALLVAGRVKLSPMLSAADTGRIVEALWNDWRHVEQRYFAITQRDAHHAGETTLNVLINHMLKSVRTLAGLLAFFPRFMRTSEIVS